MNQNFCFLGTETGISQDSVLKMHSHPRQSSSPSLPIVQSRRTLCCPKLEQIPVITRNKERVMTSSFITQLTIKRILDIFFLLYVMGWQGFDFMPGRHFLSRLYSSYYKTHPYMGRGGGRVKGFQSFCSQQQKRTRDKMPGAFQKGLCNLELEEAFKISEGAKYCFCSASTN